MAEMAVADLRQYWAVFWVVPPLPWHIPEFQSWSGTGQGPILLITHTHTHLYLFLQ